MIKSCKGKVHWTFNSLGNVNGIQDIEVGERKNQIYLRNTQTLMLDLSHRFLMLEEGFRADKS